MFSKAIYLSVVSILELEPVTSGRPYWALFLSRIHHFSPLGVCAKVSIYEYVCVWMHVWVRIGEGWILDYLTLLISTLVCEGLSLNLEFPVSVRLNG